MTQRFLGVAQLVARYLGVVEAASSSLVTQTISSVHNTKNEHSIFFCLKFVVLSRVFCSFLFYTAEVKKLTSTPFLLSRLTFCFLYHSGIVKQPTKR